MGIVVGPTDWQIEEVDSNAVQIASLGDQILPVGGYLICRNGGTAWIVAPNTSEVSRSWYCRNDAVTTATACTGTNTWFVPTCSQLQNPGSNCRTYWGYSTGRYWSSTQFDSIHARYVTPSSGGTASFQQKCIVMFVRAFRCVTY